MNLKDQVALVVGGASGLGAATARKLASLGARVAVLDFNLEAAQRVAAEVGGAAYACNVTSAESAEQAIAAARAELGAARVLVNTAGIAPAAKIVGKNGPMPLDDFRKGIEVNLVGTFNTMRLAAAEMMKLDPLEDGERGLIVNTASVAGYEGQIGQASYAASKGGVIALTIQAAREFAQVGIRVCTIAPGLFETPMMAGLPENVRASLGASVPFPPRLGRADEYAKLVAMIADNVMLNGETLRLDGALRMQAR
ncbi:NAD(P)-dependent dehydrogenase, short-chain alcohol dehydrogenase family [Hydrocarboniphaga daqingensis]|jgi:NAD(P)-dependent dehydrogenase (short-subunit alcohol dehydrogenase family)|uniref:NAD(P)-dependent dehydrogenase, short-chain alcohol dehydrogenase family n=1 Tax=Hydrocarboniphaga daqingensis TaxID=490188 RepID=A0A1M5LZQ8_9GAMM|nr:SDR family NAD(P)-dependent oxidoreductase [Hydrocarboniphaga daqingensis]SHG70169.1 NAD(P)-dependent dehydrogenase, short-chain alcohol dehydrogenase family [Hydrocarboniphaga daqingensis]